MKKESGIESAHETEKSVIIQEQHKTAQSKEVVYKSDKETPNLEKPQCVAPSLRRRSQGKSTSIQTIKTKLQGVSCDI